VTFDLYRLASDEEDFFDEPPKAAPRKKVVKDESESDVEMMPATKSKRKAKAAPKRKRWALFQMHVCCLVLICRIISVLHPTKMRTMKTKCILSLQRGNVSNRLLSPISSGSQSQRRKRRNPRLNPILQHPARSPR
jgi:hypothetical protein